MIASHLSDEVVAAFADGVLRGHARSRAARHLDTCEHCRLAVRAQRETVLALRQAPAPPLPAGLFERLRGLPGADPADDERAPEPHAGSPSRFPFGAPIAAFAPPQNASAERASSANASCESGADAARSGGLAALFAARARRRP